MINQEREREYGFQGSQENSHVQEPTPASFNQILTLGDYSETSLSSLFACHFLLIQFLDKLYYMKNPLHKGGTAHLISSQLSLSFSSLYPIHIFHLIHQNLLRRILHSILINIHVLTLIISFLLVCMCIFNNSWIYINSHILLIFLPLNAYFVQQLKITLIYIYIYIYGTYSVFHYAAP